MAIITINLSDDVLEMIDQTVAERRVRGSSRRALLTDEQQAAAQKVLDTQGAAAAGEYVRSLRAAGDAGRASRSAVVEDFVCLGYGLARQEQQQPAPVTSAKDSLRDNPFARRATAKKATRVRNQPARERDSED